MSIKKDVLRIARAGLRNLYLQIVDFYTESIKTGGEVNQYLLSYFNQAGEALPGLPVDIEQDVELLKTEASIEKFIDQKISIEEDIIQSGAFDSFEKVTQFLIQQYDAYGISQPPEGFLQVYYDVKQWWKFRTRFQNGYFIFTEVFNYDENEITKSGFNNGEPFSFNPKSNNLQINGALKTYLIKKTKQQYLEYANQNSFEKIVAEGDMQDQYFFFLDGGKNSVKLVFDANGETGKIYIRTFFNEFGQKLDASLIEIQGVAELKKVPGGIRKNYIVSNLLSAIDAYIKEQQKDGEPKPVQKERIVGLKELKKLINKSIRNRDIASNSRIGFIFTNDYEFLSAVDSENQLINNFELYRFLKDKKELNAIIVRLNAINCRLIGDPSGPSTQVDPIGATPDSYDHFVSSNKSYKNETPEQKATNYKAKRSGLKFVGDIALRFVFEEVRKYVPTEIAEIYETLLNRVDIEKLAELFASSVSNKMSVEELRKTYFKVFIQSLDIIELIDCVVENAGIPRTTKTIVTSPAFDENGDIVEDTDVERTIISQSNLDFELDLKTLLYNKFVFFYNIAKSFDPELFDFPSSDPNDLLPDLKELLDNIKQASENLAQNGPNLKSQIESKEDNLEILKEPGSTASQQLISEEEELLGGLLEQLANLEQALLNAQQTLRQDLKTNFMYILMIPNSQISKIYDVITSNDPQYKYKPQLINEGMLEARDTAGFSPELFIEILFKNEILKYSDGLSESLFQDFHDNIAEQNKKLKTTGELKKDFENNTDKDSLGKAAKTSQTSKPKVPTFPAFNLRYPTFSLDAAFSILIRKAYDEALKASLEPLVNASKTAMDNSFNGNEDSFDRLDPKLKAEYTTNDYVQNVMDGALSGFASPLEVYIKAKNEVLFTDTIEEIECLFTKLHSEIESPLQLKLLSNTLDEQDTEIEKIKQIFFDCGVSNDFSTITNFFAWLRELLGSTGGLDILLENVENARQASLRNTDLCDDNPDFLDDLIRSNDSAEARAALEKVLSSLSENNRNSFVPKPFGCSDNPGTKAAFPFYNRGTIDSQNKHVKGIINKINNFFNNDISKFKNIILKKNQNGEDITNNYFGTTDEEKKTTLSDLRKRSDEALLGDGVDDETKDQYESKQISLRSILLNLFSTSEPELSVISSEDNLTIFKFSYFTSYVYELVTNESDEQQTYLNIDLDPNATYILFYKEEDEANLFLSKVKLTTNPFDIIELYKNLIENFNVLEFASGKNELYLVDYPDAGSVLYNEGYSQRLLKFLKGGGDAFNDSDYTLGNALLLESILDSLLANFIKEASIFDNKIFNNIPLKDKENPNYSDNGILLTDEVFENYKRLRKKYQCFVTFDSIPDPHQLSNLKALYKLLFNCLITESLLKRFFILGQDQLALADDEVIKNRILTDIDEAFNSSVTRIANLQPDYRNDIDLVYKLEVLENKDRAANNLEEPLDKFGNSEWEYTAISDKVNYLAGEYYEKIKNRLKDRIALVNEDVESFDSQNDSNIFNKAPNNEINLFDVYDDVKTLDTNKGAVIPIINGLEKGLILQRYVDVRQNGSIIQQFAKGNLPGNAGPYNNDGDFVSDLTLKYLPGVELNGTAPYPHSQVTPVIYFNNIATAGYINFFFTGHSDGPANSEALDPLMPTGAPKIDYNGVQSDIDSGATYEPYSENFKNQWFRKFYRTQGKINVFDYDNFHSAASIQDEYLGKFLKENGPKTYFKKASVGVRACLVIPAPKTISNPLGSTEFINFLKDFKQDPKGKEIYKEKFGLAQDENGNRFVIIPLVAQEEDILSQQQDSWEADPDNYEWSENLYDTLSGYSYLSLRLQVIDKFNSNYPIANTFAQAIPISVQTLVESNYGDQISTIFNLTKEEILKSIKFLKSVINGEWDQDAEQMLGVNGDIDMNIYASLAFSLVPIFIKLIATFVDPTWNTPWFMPGPTQPIGYTAKILDATD